MRAAWSRLACALGWALLLCSPHCFAEKVISGAETVIDISLGPDEAAERVVLKDWYSVDVGNAPTHSARAVITLFRLAAASMTLDEEDKLRWISSTFSKQALKYSRTGLMLFREHEVTPDRLLEEAATIIKRGSGGANTFYNLAKRTVAKAHCDAPPGQERVQNKTGYTLGDLEDMTRKQVKAAQDFVAAAGEVKAGADTP